MPWPALPNVPAAEEKTTNAERSVVSSCRLSAASTLGRSTLSTCSGVSEVIVASSSTPAVCTTAPTARSSSSAFRATRSATSQATSSTEAPRASSSSRSSSAPGASGPWREVSSRLRTPWEVTRCLAKTEPRLPVAPVTSTVPRNSSPASAVDVARARRGASTAPPRTATSGSPDATAAARSTESSVSSSTNRSGCSDCADRTRPRTAAPARSVTSSPRTATAPVVTKTSRSAWSSASQVRIDVSAWRTAPDTESAVISARTAATGPVPSTGVHSTWNSERATGEVPSWSGVNSRSTSESTDATGVPVASAISSATPSAPVRETWTRSASAPTACNETLRQAKGNCVLLVEAPRDRACSTASNRAGCRPNRSAGTSSATSANTSSPHRHAERKPWNAGPYSSPAAASAG